MNSFLKGLRTGAAALTMAALIQGVGSVALGPLADAAGASVAATTAVNVRNGPSTSASKLGLLTRGEKVHVLSKSGGWAKVTWRGRTAYVATAYLTAPTNPSGTVTVPAALGTAYATANLNLRTGPSLKNAVARVATKGAKLQLAGRISGAYTQVTLQGRTYWAATSYLADSAGAPAKNLPAIKGKLRATTALMIRTTPTSSFRSLGDIPRGTIVDATGVRTNGMAQIIWQGHVRWVNGKFTSATTPNTNVPTPGGTPPKTSSQYATSDLNIWLNSSGSSYKGEIPRGSQVSITGTVQNGRAEIVHRGVLRWVTARYLSATAPSAGGGAPSPGVGGRTGINKGWSSGLDKTNKWAQKVAWHVWDHYPRVITQYGWRRDVTPDHPGGRAVDVMIPYYKNNQAYGWEIANYFRAHAREFNINYVIFGQKIWSVARSSQGWRPMGDRGGDTSNHYDHVHVNTYGADYGFN